MKIMSMMVFQTQSCNDMVRTWKQNQVHAGESHASSMTWNHSWTVTSQLDSLMLSGVKCNSSIRSGVGILAGSAYASTTTALSWSPIVKRCSEPAYLRQATLDFLLQLESQKWGSGCLMYDYEKSREEDDFHSRVQSSFGRINQHWNDSAFARDHMWLRRISKHTWNCMMRQWIWTLRLSARRQQTLNWKWRWYC